MNYPIMALRAIGVTAALITPAAAPSAAFDTTMTTVANAVARTADGAVDGAPVRGPLSGPEQVTVYTDNWLDGALTCYRMLATDPPGSRCEIVIVASDDPANQSLSARPLD